VNRETKRMLERQGSVDASGNPVRANRAAPAARAAEERTPFPQYIKEVQGELKKVAWPSRPEVKNYTIVVVITLVIMTALTFGYDSLFAKALLFIIDR
jgi:preprotein translocase subunit SecE